MESSKDLMFEYFEDLSEFSPERLSFWINWVSAAHMLDLLKKDRILPREEFECYMNWLSSTPKEMYYMREAVMNLSFDDRSKLLEYLLEGS